MVQYILVTGGVISGIGKGLISSSVGLLLKSTGLRVTAIKIDPYLNIDAGLMSPMEHGEVYVLDDGGESDLDLGNYERFLDTTLTKDHNLTTGKIYSEVIQNERRGGFLGKTVQVIPHVTDAIQDWVQKVSNFQDEDGHEADVCMIELGGTIGDIESAPFVEAMRQFQFRVGIENFCLLHVSLIPTVGGDGGEQKTKPTQMSVRDLRGLGLTPDFIMCRSTGPLDDVVKKKISLFCQVPTDQVIGVQDCSSIYFIPLMLADQGFVEILQRRLKLKNNKVDSTGSLISKWRKLASRTERAFDKVNIVIVGKYTDYQDAYLSVLKSLEHAALACNRKLVISWVESDKLEPWCEKKDPRKYHEAWQTVCAAKGIVVPGGFGERGFEGKVSAASWARRFKKPYLGICYGFQVSVVEFARNVLNLENAHTTEINPDCREPVVINMPEVSVTYLGGTMRLGKRKTMFVRDGIMRKLYGDVDSINERHRHRYEVNTKYVTSLEENGLLFVGHDEKEERMEILELKGHPYYVATQFHPEYQTRPLKPSPPFLGLILAACGLLEGYLKGDRSQVGYESNSE